MISWRCSALRAGRHQGLGARRWALRAGRKHRHVRFCSQRQCSECYWHTKYIVINMVTLFRLFLQINSKRQRQRQRKSPKRRLSCIKVSNKILNQKHVLQSQPQLHKLSKLPNINGGCHVLLEMAVMKVFASNGWCFSSRLGDTPRDGAGIFETKF